MQTVMKRLGIFATTCPILIVVATALSFSVQAADLSPRELLSLAEIGGYQGNISVSPDGSLVAFQVQSANFAARTYKIKWYAIPITGGSPVLLGDGGDLLLSPGSAGRFNGDRAEIRAQWAPNGKWIAYLRKHNKAVQVWRSKADGSVQQQVTHHAADVIDFAWTPDGSGVWYRVGYDRRDRLRSHQQEADRGFLLDERYTPAYSLQPLHRQCGEQSWSATYDSPEVRCEPRLWLASFLGHERPVILREEQQRFEQVSRSARPPKVDVKRAIRSVVWNKKSNQAAWFENESPDINPGHAAPLTLYAASTRCSASECLGQLKGVWWNGEEIIFLRHEGHAFSIPALYAWRIGDATVRSILRFDGILRSCEMGLGTLICLQEEPKTPRRIIAVDPRNGALNVVFNPNPRFHRFRLGDVERIEWKDAFGNPTFAHLVFPPNYVEGRRYPVVIVQYRSRGFLKGGVGDEYPIYPLAAAGFLVLSFDRPADWLAAAQYTGATPSDAGVAEGREWKDAYERRRALTALEIVLHNLELRGLIDPERVGITGLSDGAETVTFALFSSSLFAAAAASGDWTPAYYSLAVKESHRVYFRSLFGAKSGAEVVEKWKAYSIADHAHKVTAPLLIQVSDRELIATAPIHVALKDAGKAVETYVFPDEYHIKWQPQHKLAVAERAIDWFLFWLHGIENSAPAKAEQYKRWRVMRVKQCELYNGVDAPWYCRQ